jgi:acetyl esterase
MKSEMRIGWFCWIALALLALGLAHPAAAASEQGRRAKANSGSASQAARKGSDPASEQDSADADAWGKDVEPGKRYVYKTSNGEPQELEVYFPKDWDPAKNRVPGVIMFHGGAWGHGDLTAFRYACKYLASRGLVATTANYKLITAEKQGALPVGESRKRVGIIDAKSAIRWMKQHAAELGVDRDRIIAGGASAGGHLAVLSAINADLNDPSDPRGINTKVVAYLLFNPAFTPVGREDDSQVDVFQLLKPGLAPSIMFFGTEDKKWKPAADELAKRIKANGDETVMWTAEGQRHSFYRQQSWYDLTLIEADHFLVAHGLLNGPCTLSASPSGEKLKKVEP